jgi:RNA polymerase sigma factor (sigma-70 family)
VDPSDAVLVARARDGDRAALSMLVDRHRPTALALCTGLLRRPDLAEDAVQEALVVAIVGLDRLRRADRFGPWLCGIALNVARRWLHDVARRPDLPDVPERPDVGPEQSVVAADDAARVRRAVAGLPAGQRQAVALYYLAGRTGSEVADILSISPAAAKTRLHKGRRALRHRLAGEREIGHGMVTGIEMHVAEVLREPAGDGGPQLRRHALVLEDGSGDRRLPIYVGDPEATAIALQLAQADLPRPLTHVLLSNVIGALGARLVGVRVTRLAGGTFFGEIEMDGPGGRVTVDARPSDAIGLAVLSQTSILVEPGVLDEVEVGGRGDVDPALTEGVEQIVADFQASLREVMRRFAGDPDADPAHPA